MDPKKAYGVITALGKELGEAARAAEDQEPIPGLKKTADREAFTRFLREYPFKLPEKLVHDFTAMLTEEDWQRWKSMLVLQAKMVAKGDKPTMGHETGRGVSPG